MKSLKFNSGFKKGSARLKHQLASMITETLFSEKFWQTWKKPANSWYPLQCTQVSSYKILLRATLLEQKYTDFCTDVLGSPSVRYRPQKQEVIKPRRQRCDRGTLLTTGTCHSPRATSPPLLFCQRTRSQTHSQLQLALAGLLYTPEIQCCCTCWKWICRTEDRRLMMKWEWKRGINF